MSRSAARPTPGAPAPRSPYNPVFLSISAAAFLSAGVLGYLMFIRPAPVPGALEQSGGHVPMLGKAGPVVTVFEDINCPHCQDFEEAAGGELAAMARAGRLRLVSQQLGFVAPSSAHAAELLGCIEASDAPRFWAVRTALFRAGAAARAAKTEFTASAMDDVARAQGVNVVSGPVATCVASGEGRRILDRTADLATRTGVNGTPSVFVGSQYVRSTMDAVRAALDAQVSQEQREQALPDVHGENVGAAP